MHNIIDTFKSGNESIVRGCGFHVKYSEDN